MHKIDGPNATPSNTFQDKNLSIGQAGTAVTAAWLNAVQEELLNVVTAAGLTPDKTDNGQLLAAILVHIATNAGGGGGGGGSVYWINPVSTASNLPSGKPNGTIALALDTGVLHKFNGSSWVVHYSPAVLADKISSAARGANNGVAPLDSAGKVPLANLPVYRNWLTGVRYTAAGTVAYDTLCLAITTSAMALTIPAPVNTFDQVAFARVGANALTVYPPSGKNFHGKVVNAPYVFTNDGDSALFIWDGTEYIAVFVGGAVGGGGGSGPATTDDLAEGAVNKYFTDARAVTAVNAQKNIANGVAGLGSDGKLADSVMPALSIIDRHIVGNQADMLALTAQKGDIAFRTDISRSFILAASPASTLSNWSQFLTPESPVTSVAGRVGDVVLTKTDVGLANVDNTSDLSKPVSTAQQTALDSAGLKPLPVSTSQNVTLNRSLLVNSTSGVINLQNVAMTVNDRFLVTDHAKQAGTNVINIYPVAGTAFKGMAINDPVTLNIAGSWAAFYSDGTDVSFITLGVSSGGGGGGLTTAERSTNFVALNNQINQVDSSLGSFTGAAPATASGVYFEVWDSGNNAQNNNIIVTPGTGKRFENGAPNEPFVINENGSEFSFLWSVNKNCWLVRAMGGSNIGAIQAPAIGEWKAPASTAALVPTNIASPSFTFYRYRQVGSTMEIEFFFQGGAGSGSSAVQFPVPDGLTPLVTYNCGHALTYNVTQSVPSTTNFAVVGAEANETNKTIQFLKSGSGANLIGTDVNASCQFRVKVAIPIKEWAGQQTLPMGPGAYPVYASNSSTTTATDATSFAYGEDGALIQSFASTGTGSVQKRVRSPYPNPKYAKLQIKTNGRNWVDLSSTSFGFATNDAGSTFYGVEMYPVSGSPTDYDVIFYSGPFASATWSAGGGHRWRVVFADSPMALGIKEAEEFVPGLLKAYKEIAWAPVVTNISNLTGTPVVTATATVIGRKVFWELLITGIVSPGSSAGQRAAFTFTLPVNQKTASDIFVGSGWAQAGGTIITAFAEDNSTATTNVGYCSWQIQSSSVAHTVSVSGHYTI